MEHTDQVLEVSTDFGPARAHVRTPSAGPVRGRLVLGHGAGGGIEAADLVVARSAAVSLGWQVVLVEQPWRVAGKRVAPAPARLDIGWLAVLAALRGSDSPEEAQLPLVLGGRSAGARVACRTALELGARAVCCLAFPLHPPGRPERSRAGELGAPPAGGVPVLVVQGEQDPFGGPAELTALGLPDVEVVGVPGNHTLARTSAAAAAVAGAVAEGLSGWGQE
jgi:predicted alpha/beta-hydrolase family hydrolase